MTRLSNSIRTPDQKLRVFLSSTLKELGAERVSARAAIEHLHLAPVMFELGARPHPPRDLYRAYLDQSEIFVGIYGKSYGWVAPTEVVSGLEDEFNLSGDLPKLIYIQETTDDRDPRLDELLTRIRTDDEASFKYFRTPDELRALVEEDLATLLAERFASSRIAQPTAEKHVAGTTTEGVLPAQVTELIGRSSEDERLRALVLQHGVRLVSVTGPGGMGKSRLAISVSAGLSAEFAGGVFFVDLAPITDSTAVAGAIAHALGVRDTGDGPVVDKIVLALRDRRVLLVLDNFEQVIPAASVLTTLLTALPLLSLIVTTRTLLRISAEHSFELGPLALPGTGRTDAVAIAAHTAAVTLFVQRARAVKPDFELTEDNATAVVAICVALEGVPLALELAAARIRILTPLAMLERLDSQLPLLTGGVSDLPERQQTLLNTIEWSTQLLGDDERHLLAELGVFVGGFTIAAAERVHLSPRPGADVLTMLGALVDSSLVRQEERDQRPFFTMLATVHEYAVNELKITEVYDDVRARHADYFVGLSTVARPHLDGPAQSHWIAQLSDDHNNLRAAARYLIENSEWTSVTRFAWALYIYWWIGGHLGEVRALMDEVLGSADSLPRLSRAHALYFTSAIRFWQDPGTGVIDALTESAALFAAESEEAAQALALVSLALAQLEGGDPETAETTLETCVNLFRNGNDRWGEAMALVSLGLVALLKQKVPRALNRFEESLVLTERQGDELGGAIALHHHAWAHLFLGDQAAALTEFETSFATSVRLGHNEGVAYGFEGLAAVAAAADDIDRAGLLLGAAHTLRAQTGLFNAPSFSFHQRAVDVINAGAEASRFQSAEKAGRAMSVDSAIAAALHDSRLPGSVEVV
jgi:predicted ATPase